MPDPFHTLDPRHLTATRGGQAETPARPTPPANGVQSPNATLFEVSPAMSMAGKHGTYRPPPQMIFESERLR
jgi:hypothetical protein